MNNAMKLQFSENDNKRHRKVQRFELSYLEAANVIHGITLTVPKKGLRISNFKEKNLLFLFLKNVRKITKKKRISRHIKDLSSDFWRQNLQPLGLPW